MSRIDLGVSRPHRRKNFKLDGPAERLPIVLEQQAVAEDVDAPWKEAPMPIGQVTRRDIERKH